MKHIAINFVLCIASCSSPLVLLGDELTLTETDERILVTLREAPVLQYVKRSHAVPVGLDEHYSRSGYIHPVYTPTGQEITGDYPPDHAHQHALFFAWTKAKFKGKEVDFWNQAKELGNIEFREVLNVQQKANQVSFCVKHAFMVKEGEMWVDALHETWTVSIYRTPADHFLFDITSEQQCATDEPVVLAKYHYGGMAFRGNYTWLKDKKDDSINPGDLQFLTSEGKNRWEGNHTRPDWVAFSGQIDGQNASAAILGSPKNFRAPQHVRIHPNKPYFCFAPMVDEEFEIKPGDKYVSHYRYLITSKPLDLDMIRQHWNTFKESPSQ